MPRPTGLSSPALPLISQVCRSLIRPLSRWLRISNSGRRHRRVRKRSPLACRRLLLEALARPLSQDCVLRPAFLAEGLPVLRRFAFCDSSRSPLGRPQARLFSLFCFLPFSCPQRWFTVSPLQVSASVLQVSPSVAAPLAQRCIVKADGDCRSTISFQGEEGRGPRASIFFSFQTGVSMEVRVVLAGDGRREACAGARRIRWSCWEAQAEVGGREGCRGPRIRGRRGASLADASKSAVAPQGTHLVACTLCHGYRGSLVDVCHGRSGCGGWESPGRLIRVPDRPTSCQREHRPDPVPRGCVCGASPFLA